MSRWKFYKMYYTFLRNFKKLLYNMLYIINITLTQLKVVHKEHIFFYIDFTFTLFAEPTYLFVNFGIDV